MGLIVRDKVKDLPCIVADLFHDMDGKLRSEEHTSELQSQSNLVCRLLLEKKKNPASNSPPASAHTAPMAGRVAKPSSLRTPAAGARPPPDLPDARDTTASVTLPSPAPQPY